MVGVGKVETFLSFYSHIPPFPTPPPKKKKKTFPLKNMIVLLWVRTNNPNRKPFYMGIIMMASGLFKCLKPLRIQPHGRNGFLHLSSVDASK